jgi:hypothetical protein
LMHDVPTVAEVVARLKQAYVVARARVTATHFPR